MSSERERDIETVRLDFDGRYIVKVGNAAVPEIFTGAEVLDRLRTVLAARDDPELDATDFAHPAWWRGNDRGVEATVRALNKVLDEGHDGTFGFPPFEQLAQRIAALAAREGGSEEDDVEAWGIEVTYERGTEHSYRGLDVVFADPKSAKAMLANYVDGADPKIVPLARLRTGTETS